LFGNGVFVCSPVTEFLARSQTVQLSLTLELPAFLHISNLYPIIVIFVHLDTSASRRLHAKFQSEDLPILFDNLKQAPVGLRRCHHSPSTSWPFPPHRSSFFPDPTMRNRRPLPIYLQPNFTSLAFSSFPITSTQFFSICLAMHASVTHPSSGRNSKVGFSFIPPPGFRYPPLTRGFCCSPIIPTHLPSFLNLL
jgi:hypothetical protein